MEAKGCCPNSSGSRTAANKPSAAEMADFQEGVATEAYGALRKEFADILKPAPRVP